MKWLAFVFWAFSLNAFSQEEKSEIRELFGQIGGRSALATLYVLNQADGSARLTGEYLVLPLLQQRYLEGERSKQLGVTFLREGHSQIFYGRPPSATLQGLWSDGVLKGARYGPGGQPREKFELSEQFPSLEGYSGEVRCEAAAEGRYASTLAYVVAGGKLKAFEWRSQQPPGKQGCALQKLAQQPFSGGLRFAAAGCQVTLRDLGEYLKVAAEGCARFCSPQGVLEPLLVERKGGGCQLLRAAAK